MPVFDNKKKVPYSQLRVQAVKAASVTASPRQVLGIPEEATDVLIAGASQSQIEDSSTETQDSEDPTQSQV